MLRCTDAAASTLKLVREQQGIPEDYGLRMSTAQSQEGERGLRLDFVESPAEGDAVTEDNGERLYVAPELTEVLADVALDVAPPASANGQDPPQLVLRRAEEV